jgi:outer membrane protein
MRLVTCALLIMGATNSAVAQARDTAAGPVLTLEEAIGLARRNNPVHLQSLTAQQRAGASLRSAYGQLLPSFDTNFGTSYREGKPQFFAGQRFGSSSDVLSSSASLQVGAQYNIGSVLAPKQQRASLDAAQADVTSSEQTLRANVTLQYLNVLQAQARASLQDTLLANTQAQLDLARARESVGAATTLDVRRAEVAVGQQQVAVLQSRNTVEVEKLRLFQQMGVPQPANVRLTSELPVTEPTLKLDDLLNQSRSANPGLASLRSRQEAANIGVRSAKSLYTPTLSLNTGINGFTSQNQDIESQINDSRNSVASSRRSCFTNDSLRTRAGLPSISAQCNAIAFTDAQANAIRSANEVFPFDFTRNPITVNAQLSIPIFDGFNREQRVQQAVATRRDAEYQVKARELQLVADVTSAHLTLVTAYRTVRLQEQNSQAAREALMLAQERFRVGANTFVDVSQARADYERAETDRINAIYDFHKAYATLEGAVGRPIR